MQNEENKENEQVEEIQQNEELILENNEEIPQEEAKNDNQKS